MESLTIGEIAIALAFVVGIITSITFLHKTMKDWLSKSLKGQLDSIDRKIDGLHDRINDVDIVSNKNFIIRFLADIDKGVWLDDVEKERFYEAYNHYIEINGNGYVKHKVEQLEKDGKL